MIKLIYSLLGFVCYVFPAVILESVSISRDCISAKKAVLSATRQKIKRNAELWVLYVNSMNKR
jgi:hypothetical protein